MWMWSCKRNCLCWWEGSIGQGGAWPLHDILVLDSICMLVFCPVWTINCSMKIVPSRWNFPYNLILILDLLLRFAMLFVLRGHSCHMYTYIHNWISYSVWIATACETWHLLQPAGSTPTVTVPPVTEICTPIGQCSTDEFKWFCQCPHILSNSVGIGVKSELRSQLQGEWPNNFHGEWCNALQLTGKIAWRISSYLFHTIYIEAVMIITMKRKV